MEKKSNLDRMKMGMNLILEKDGQNKWIKEIRIISSLQKMIFRLKMIIMNKNKKSKYQTLKDKNKMNKNKTMNKKKINKNKMNKMICLNMEMKMVNWAEGGWEGN